MNYDASNGTVKLTTLRQTHSVTLKVKVKVPDDTCVQLDCTIVSDNTIQFQIHFQLFSSRFSSFQTYFCKRRDHSESDSDTQ